MKSKSYILTLIVAAFIFTSCSEKKQEAEHNHDEHAKAEGSEVTESSAPQYSVDANFQQQLNSVFTAYVAVKDALVASDPAKVKTEAAATDAALQKVDMKLVTGAAHNDWMNYQTTIQSSLKQIQSSNDIEEQRKSFSDLTDGMYKSIKAFGLGGNIAFYEYCPMAFNDQGGYWLSTENKIRNPYFGDKMLTCGEVREKLK